MRDGSVRRRVQESTLLWLEELGPDRRGWPVPPKPTHDVGRPCWLVRPALREQIGSVPGEIKAVASLRNRAVPGKGHRKRIPPKVQMLTPVLVERWVEALRPRGEIPDRIAHRYVWSTVVGVGPMCRLRRPGQRFLSCDSHQNSALTLLGCAVVGGVEDTVRELVSRAIPPSRESVAAAIAKTIKALVYSLSVNKMRNSGIAPIRSIVIKLGRLRMAEEIKTVRSARAPRLLTEGEGREPFA